METVQSLDVWYRLLFRVRYILIARYMPNPANKQRTIPDVILYKTKFITAKTRVKPAYENTTIGRYLLTFSAISIISTISFIRSAVVCTYLHYHYNNAQQMIIMLLEIQFLITSLEGPIKIEIEGKRTDGEYKKPWKASMACTMEESQKIQQAAILISQRPMLLHVCYCPPELKRIIIQSIFQNEPARIINTDSMRFQKRRKKKYLVVLGAIIVSVRVVSIIAYWLATILLYIQHHIVRCVQKLEKPWFHDIK